MKPIDFKTTGYFSGNLQFLGVVLVVGGAVLASKSMVASAILFLISLVIFTTHYRLAVDLAAKTYHDYLWILGVKSGSRGKFENIDCLFIRKVKVSQTMNLQSLSTTIRKEVYDGYLKFSDQEKIHLTTKDSKEALLLALKPIAAKLNIGIVDFSEP